MRLEALANDGKYSAAAGRYPPPGSQFRVRRAAVGVAPAVGRKMIDGGTPAASVLVVDDTIENLRLLSHMLGERDMTFAP